MSTPTDETPIMTEEEYQKITEETKKLKLPEVDAPPQEEEPSDEEHIETEEEIDPTEEEHKEESARLAEDANTTQEGRDEQTEQDRLCHDFYEEVDRELDNQESEEADETPEDKQLREEYEEYCRLEQELIEEQQEKMTVNEELPYEAKPYNSITALQAYWEKETDADPEFIEAVAIQTMAIFTQPFTIKVGSRTSVNKFFESTKNLPDTSGNPLILWTIAFGKARKARKSTIIRKVMEMLHGFELDYGVKIMLAPETSPQALMALSKR